MDSTGDTDEMSFSSQGQSQILLRNDVHLAETPSRTQAFIRNLKITVVAIHDIFANKMRT